MIIEATWWIAGVRLWTTNTATVVNLTAPLPSGATVVSSSVTQGSSSTANNQLTAAFGSIAPGAAATVTLVLNPTVAGTLTTKMAGPLIRLWEQMPEPKWCVAMGDCTCSGGRYKRSYSTIEGIDRVMPVDVYVPGCPPRPEGLIYGMMKLQQLVKDRRGKWRERAIVPTVPEGV